MSRGRGKMSRGRGKMSRGRGKMILMYLHIKGDLPLHYWNNTRELHISVYQVYENGFRGSAIGIIIFCQYDSGEQSDPWTFCY
jgi:hypothetical protein